MERVAEVDVLKVAIGLLAYLVLPPVLATLAARNRSFHRGLLATMMFMTALPVSVITLTAYNLDGYRGHVRGFEFCTVDIVALGLLGSVMLREPKRLRLAVAPAVLYLLMCLGDMVGLVNAVSPFLGWAAVFKYSKAVLPLMAACVAIENEDDLRWLWWAMAVGLVAMLVVGLKDRYVHGMWRISAMFEHSNSMAMWAYMLSVTLLGTVLVDRGRMAFVLTSLLAVAGGGALVVLSLARASLVAYAVGVSGILLITLVRRPSVRAATVAALLLVATVGMGALAADSIMNRVNAAKDQDGIENYRSALNRQAALMLHDHPLGIGWNNYGVVNSRPHGERYSVIMEDWERTIGHHIYEDNFRANPLTESYYWLQLAENGYLGFCGHLLFFVVSLRWCWRATWRHHRTVAGGFALACTLTLSLLYLHSTIERVLVQTKNLDAWLILIGACVAILNFPSADNRPGESSGVARVQRNIRQADGIPSALDRK